MHAKILFLRHHVFFCQNGSGTIDFREYVIGLSLVSSPENTEDTIKFAFQVKYDRREM